MSARELAQLAEEAARMAGALLLERATAGSRREVRAKSTPTDLVSDADEASERAIRQLLAQRRPHDGYVGEEDSDSAQPGARGGDQDDRGALGDSGLSWVVDPLDGTVNFLFGIPQWSVSVAVRDRAGTVAGAVYDPNRDELFTATRGGPATLRSPAGELAPEGGRVLSGSSRRDLPTAMIATGLAYDAGVREAQARVLARLVGGVRDIRRFGSAALDLAWTAAGRYDAYFERSVKQWDIAAGALVCERAGLVVGELAPQDSLPWGIVAAPPALMRPLRELVDGPAPPLR